MAGCSRLSTPSYPSGSTHYTQGALALFATVGEEPIVLPCPPRTLNDVIAFQEKAARIKSVLYCSLDKLFLSPSRHPSIRSLR